MIAEKRRRQRSQRYFEVLCKSIFAQKIQRVEKVQRIKKVIVVYSRWNLEFEVNQDQYLVWT